MTLWADPPKFFFPLASGDQLLTGGDLTVTMKERHHTLLRFRTRDSLDSTRFTSGSPLQVVWGTTPVNRRSVFAYVGYNTPWDLNPKAPHAMETTAFGVTFWMKEAHQRSWERRSIKAIIGDVCSNYRINAVIPPSPRGEEPLQAIVQDGSQSDFEFLATQCQRYGLSMVEEGTTLMFIDKLYALEQYPGLGRAVATLTLRDSVKANFGAGATGGGRRLRNRVGFGFDIRTLQIHRFLEEPEKVTGNFGAEVEQPLFTEYINIPVESPAVGRELLEGLNAENRWVHTANVECDGDPRVVPGTIVRVFGHDNATDGLWYVEEAEHRIRQNAPYVMELKIGRDSRSWVGVPDPVVSYPVRPTTKLFQGKWVSDWSQAA